MKTKFKPRFIFDLPLLRDYVPINETITFNHLFHDYTMYVIGYFPYSTAMIRGHSIPRFLFKKMEFKFNELNCYDNKYVVVTNYSGNITCYYFHDNDVVIGDIDSLQPYNSVEWKLIDRYMYVSYKLKQYDRSPKSIECDIENLIKGKRGVDISDAAAGVITSFQFLHLYGSEEDYHKNK